MAGQKANGKKTMPEPTVEELQAQIATLKAKLAAPPDGLLAKAEYIHDAIMALEGEEIEYAEAMTIGAAQDAIGRIIVAERGRKSARAQTE